MRARLSPRFGSYRAVLLAALGFIVLYGVLIAVMPSFGELSANTAHSDQFGFAQAATETPQPITNILATPLTVDGKTIAPGQEETLQRTGGDSVVPESKLRQPRRLLSFTVRRREK